MPFEVDWSPEQAMRSHCCPAMASALMFQCDQHADPFACGDSLVIYNAIFDEYGLIVHDGGTTYVLIDHCPWCGAKLPESQRDRWFDEISGLELDGDRPPPSHYLSDDWRLPPIRR
jgi:hypothetical protein